MTDSRRGPDHEALSRAKSVLRLRARAARRSVLPEYRTAHAYAIAERVLNLTEITEASAVSVYGPSPEEVDISVLEFALRVQGVRIAYPRVAGQRELTLHWVDDGARLVVGAFGLREPAAGTPVADLNALSALVIPGVAFDAAGNRLGFGGGYYDTLLAATENVPLTIGVAYDEQVVSAVPHHPHDRRMDIVVTPTRTYRSATTWS